LTLPLGGLVCWQAKANVCNVRRHKLFSAGAFLIKLFSAWLLEAVSVAVKSCQKDSSFKVRQFDVSTVAHRVSANGQALLQVGYFITSSPEPLPN